MLCQFSFQNFKSYKDETTFDFRAMAIPEFQDALIRQEKAVCRTRRLSIKWWMGKLFPH